MRRRSDQLEGPTGEVLSVALSPDGSLTGGKDGTVRLWHLRGANP